jgi:hypothetical protein
METEGATGALTLVTQNTSTRRRLDKPRAPVAAAHLQGIQVSPFLPVLALLSEPKLTLGHGFLDQISVLGSNLYLLVTTAARAVDGVLWKSSIGSHSQNPLVTFWILPPTEYVSSAHKPDAHHLIEEMAKRSCCSLLCYSYLFLYPA